MAPPAPTAGRAEAGSNAVCTTAGRSLLLTLRQLSLYDLETVPRTIGRETVQLQAAAMEQRADYLMFGAVTAQGRNLVFRFGLFDRAKGTTERVSVGSRRQQGNGRSEFHFAIAPNGTFTVFTSEADNLVPNDTNGTWDVFLHRAPKLAGPANR